MLNYTIDEFKQTRFYQEVKAEGVEEGRLEMLVMLLTSKFGAYRPFVEDGWGAI